MIIQKDQKKEKRKKLDSVTKIIEFLSQSSVYWSLAVITLLLVSFSASKMAKYYSRLAEIKKKRKELENELSRINAKLEALRPAFKVKGEK